MFLSHLLFAGELILRELLKSLYTLVSLFLKFQYYYQLHRVGLKLILKCIYNTGHIVTQEMFM